MARSTQQADWLINAVSWTMFWLSVMLMFGGILPSAAQPGVASSSNEISLHQVHSSRDFSWAETCVALAADDQEDVTAPGQDMVEAGDGIGLVHTSLFGRSSHRLALGLVTHPAFDDRPEAGAKHARAPPSILFA